MPRAPGNMILSIVPEYFKGIFNEFRGEFQSDSKDVSKYIFQTKFEGKYEENLRGIL